MALMFFSLLSAVALESEGARIPEGAFSFTKEKTVPEAKPIGKQT